MEKATDNVNLPLVSICIPAYNCAEYILEALNCLCNQSYRNLEIIVVNDGSTDQTVDLILQLVDPRIMLVNTLNGGAAKARNIAYQHATGKFIIFFDADDYIGPDFVDHQLRKISMNKNAVVLSAWGRFYKNDRHTFREVPLPAGEMLVQDWINYYWYNCNPMTNPGRAIMCKMLIEKAGLWNENLSLNDDLEFFTRVFLEADGIVFNPDALFYYRSGITGLSTRKGSEANRSLFDSIEIATNLVLKKYTANAAIRRSCANLWQGSIHLLYPYEKAMVKIAEEKIRALGGADLPYRSGGYTKFLAQVLGWKLTILVKYAIAGG